MCKMGMFKRFIKSTTCAVGLQFSERGKLERIERDSRADKMGGEIKSCIYTE